MGLMALKALMILSTGRLSRNSVYTRFSVFGFRCSHDNKYREPQVMTQQVYSHLNRKRQYGFTLIELTLVSVIILILITLSMPLFRRTYEDLKITSCAKDISQIIHFSRERAIFERRNYRIIIDTKSNTYQILVHDEEGDGFKPLADRWGRMFHIPKDIEIRTDIKQIDFLPGGVSDSAVIYIIRENRTYSIILDGSTGSIKVDDKTE